MLKLNAGKLIETRHEALVKWQDRSANSYNQLKADILPGLLKDVVKSLEVKASKGQALTTCKEVPKELLHIKSDELSEFIAVTDGYLSVMKAPNKKGYLQFELSESEFY